MLSQFITLIFARISSYFDRFPIEVLKYGIFSDKSDVFMFGVLMWEAYHVLDRSNDRKATADITLLEPHLGMHEDEVRHIYS